MQSDAITFPKATLGQSTREAVDFRSQSFVSPYFFVFDESNLFLGCFYPMTQSFCRCHSHIRFQAASMAALDNHPKFSAAGLSCPSCRNSCPNCLTAVEGFSKERSGCLKPRHEGERQMLPLLIRKHH
jgi:hypothetical protein